MTVSYLENVMLIARKWQLAGVPTEQHFLGVLIGGPLQADVTDLILPSFAY
jgi:hypothetical protein